MTNTLTRRAFMQAGGGASLAALLTACGFGVGGQKRSAVTLWDISTDKEQQLVKEIVDAFNSSHEGASVTAQFFQNDPYKNKLRVSLGSGDPPDLFYGWGGGILQSYVTADKVHPLSGEVDTGRYFPSVMRAVTFDDTVYGVPNGGTDPVVFYYNKPLFDEHGVSPPSTWSELLSAVEKFRDEGVTPLSLAGKNKWPALMYEEYLVDRIGGPEPFQRVLRGESGAWSDPAFLEANGMIQDLVKMDAFPKGYTSLDYDTGESSQLLFTGRAAMQLMGAWDYGNFLSDAPEFVEQGKLGWFTFPEVEGGDGDPRDIVGNLSTFYSVAKGSDHKKAATTFLRDAVMNDRHVRGLVGLGAVPPVSGIESQLRGSQSPEWLMFLYELTKNAPYFDLSWDQALPPSQAQALLTSLDLLFLLKITPKEFSERMNNALRKSNGG